MQFPSKVTFHKFISRAPWYSSPLQKHRLVDGDHFSAFGLHLGHGESKPSPPIHDLDHGAVRGRRSCPQAKPSPPIYGRLTSHRGICAFSGSSRFPVSNTHSHISRVALIRADSWAAFVMSGDAVEKGAQLVKSTNFPLATRGVCV